MSQVFWNYWEKDCVPENELPGAMDANVIDRYLGKIEFAGWTAFENRKKIKKSFFFSNMKLALQFEQEVMQEAMRQNHLPKVSLEGEKCNITLTTKKMNGLTMNDFILAARIDHLRDVFRSKHETNVSYF